MTLILCGTILIALWAFHRGHFLSASLIFIFSLWVYSTIVLFFLGGISNPIVISFVFLIMVGGILLEKKGIFLTTGLSLFSCTVVWILGEYGRIPESIITITNVYYWSAAVIVLIACAAVLYLGIDSLNKALDQAQQNENKLAEKIESRTKDLSATNEALIVEIDEHRQTEKALAESEARFKRLFDQSPDAMFLMDYQDTNVPWRIVECNEAAARMNGYTQEEMIGQSIFMFVANRSDDRVPGIEAIKEMLDHNNITLFETLHRHKNGYVFPIEVAITSITFDGKEYILGQDRDITERKKVEDDLKAAHEKLEQRVAQRTADLQIMNASMQAEIKERQRAETERQKLIEELEAKNNELEQFAYTVSHDLKSPLITISGFLNFMEHDIQAGKTERAAQDIRRILSATSKMQALLDNLLELSRVGHITNEPTAVSLSRLVNEAAELLHGPITKRGVSLGIANPMPDVYVDEPRFVEVFQNLISNAIKFMGNEENPTIEIGLADETDKNVTCFVKDNGVGIEPQFQDQVFDLFERLDNDVDGTGIGLSLVKRIVDVHNGRIWVESAGIGQGTTFFITLPKPN